MEKKCDLMDSIGRCKKFGSPLRKCENCMAKESWFMDTFKTCDMENVCRRTSIFGNSYYEITEEDIEALRQGKVLYDIDEYGTFIRLESRSGK